MCTVTFVSTENQYIITSNRDEAPSRSASEICKTDKGIIFPKDKKAGGTWFAVNKNGNAIVLLNGAFIKHSRKDSYRKSRGIIVLESIEKEKITEHLETISLENIEPFTLIIFEENRLFEFRWDEKQKFLKELNTSENHIWSSATLYDENAQLKRKNWFENFMENHEKNAENLFKFHTSENGDIENGIVMKRPLVETISTTQIKISENISMKHLKFEDGVIFEEKLELIEKVI